MYFISILITFSLLLKANDCYESDCKSDTKSVESDELYSNAKNARNFTGKVVLVTGSSWGIGEGIAKLFSVFGAHVVVHGRNQEEVKRVAKEVKKLSPNDLKPLEVIADLQKSEDIKRLVDEITAKYGRLDVLVNNAAMYTPVAFKSSDIINNFDDIMTLNVRAILELIHLTVPHLSQSNGSIVNIASIVGIHGVAGMFSYSCSKAAVITLGQVLALELGPKIRVNTLSPGVTEKSGKSSDPAYKKQFAAILQRLVPMKRTNDPISIAKGVVFLASKEADFITGANLVIDGGLVMNFPGIIA